MNFITEYWEQLTAFVLLVTIFGLSQIVRL